MSTLIKARSAGDLRAHPWGAIEPHFSPLSAEEQTILELQKELAALKREITRRADEHKKELEHARAEGERRAAEAFARDESEALRLLTSAIAATRTSVVERLASAEALGLSFCEAALEQLLGRGDHASLVRAFIHTQLGVLRRELVLSVTVSEADFTDARALEALQSSLRDVRLIVSEALQQGACEFQLHLGKIEFSLTEYRERLRAELLRLTDACAAP